MKEKLVLGNPHIVVWQGSAKRICDSNKRINTGAQLEGAVLPG
jgi:hypothetical protein